MMNRHDIEVLRDAEPFLPFWMRLKDGIRVPVNERESVALPGDYVVYVGNGHRHIRLEDIEAVEVDERGRRKQMTLETMKQMYHAEPFVPFNICLADGRKVPVLSPEFFASAPVGRIVTVYQPDGSFNMIDLLLVSDLEVTPTPILENEDDSN